MPLFHATLRVFQLLPLAALLTILPGPILAGEKTAITVGVFASDGIESARRQWQPTLDYLNEQLDDYHFTLTAVPSGETLYKRASQRDFDLVITRPDSYARMQVGLGATALLTLARPHQDGAVSQSGAVVFTRSDNRTLRRLYDVVDHSLVATSGAGYGGWLFFKNELKIHGIDTDRYLKRIEFLQQSPQALIAAVVAGRYDSGVIPVGALEELAAQGRLDLSTIRVLPPLEPGSSFPLQHTTRLYPEWPLAKFVHTPAHLATTVATSLLHRPRMDSASPQGGDLSWTHPADYATVHSLLRTFQLPPYDTPALPFLPETLQPYYKPLLIVVSTGFIVGSLMIIFLLRMVLQLHDIRRALSRSHQEMEHKIAERTLQLREEVESRRMAEKGISASEQRLRRTMDTVIDAIITIDSDGIIQDCNNATLDLFGYRREELIGSNVSVLTAAEHREHHDEYIRRYEHTGISRIMGTGREVEAVRKDGSVFTVDLSISELNLDNQRLYIGLVHDLTARKALENTIRENEERLKRSQIFANIGTWDWNIRSGELFWSERIASLFGLPRHTRTSYDAFLEAVHPDDRESVIRAVNDCIEKGTDYDIEHRAVWPDGSVHWLHERGDVIRDRDGKPLNMLGVVQEITERKRLEQDLATQRQLMTLLHNSMAHFMTSGDMQATARVLLTGILELTASGYGFAGEIMEDGNGSYLKIHAIADNGQGGDFEAFYLDNMSTGMEFRNPDTLFGQALRSGKIIISNDGDNSDYLSELPSGHPRLRKYIVVPVYYGSEVVGMYGLANRACGYDQELLDFLEPFTMTYGILIHAGSMARQEQEQRYSLQQAKAMADRANRAKSDFLSRMSHELRTPMNAILGFTQLLMIDRQLLNDEQQDNINEIQKAGQHLLELINDVLDLSRIEAGGLKLESGNIELSGLMDECHSLVQPLALARAISLTIDSSCREPVVYADRTRLKQIFINLLSNAIKYNHEGGTVEIYCDSDATRTRVYIRDSGQGIAAQHREEIFSAFNRLDADNSHVEGTGIGLMIARRLAHAMQGELDFDSTPGQGSTFWVSVPNARSAIPSDNDPQQARENSNAPAAVPEAKPHARHCVLYIEDNPANLRLIQHVVAREQDVELLGASTAEQGLELARQLRPALVLLDINLPGMSGIEVLARLQEDDTTRHIPVVAISANAMPRDIEQGLAAGFRDYLTKPINVPRFMQMLKKMLDGSAGDGRRDIA